MKKNILITGARRGLGLFLAEQFIKNGWEVYRTSSSEKYVMEQASNKVLFLDYRNVKSVSALVKSLDDQDLKIDAVIHNAGIAVLSPAEDLCEKELRDMYDINFFGPIALTQALLPNLKKNNKANLIFISSIVSVEPWYCLGGYGSSKKALEAVAFDMATTLSKFKIYLSVIQPNPIHKESDIIFFESSSLKKEDIRKKHHFTWENRENLFNVCNDIINTKEMPKFYFQTGPHSDAVSKRFVNRNEYEKVLTKLIKSK